MEVLDGKIRHMNRLVIIGNGFDLAHGFKSSYSDFMADYLCNAVNSFYNKLSYSDKLMEIKWGEGFRGYGVKPKDVTKDDVLETFERLRNSNRECSIIFHSSILKNAYFKINQLKWVDLEVEFFRVLSRASIESNSKVRAVNEQLDILKNKLIEYLVRELKHFLFPPKKDDFINCFTENILKDEIVTTMLPQDLTPENIYFLNFNYTSILDDYVKDCNEIIPSELNNIHGTLNGENGTPIFGFGDEFDKKYIAFEKNANYKDLFKHIKSFEYLKTKNYYELIRFIENKKFQVHIYGHSCGLSDRTMLNQIFEHENCLSIKVFYHNKKGNNNDYKEKTYEISRHFKNKIMFRNKLIPEELSKEMPQPKVDYSSTLE